MLIANSDSAALLYTNRYESSSSSGATFQPFTTNFANQVKLLSHVLHTRATNLYGSIALKPLALIRDKTNGKKCIHGLTEVRVKSAKEAKILLCQGQLNQTIFTTYANRSSSQSHGVFTIKLIHVRHTARSIWVPDWDCNAIPIPIRYHFDTIPWDRITLSDPIPYFSIPGIKKSIQSDKLADTVSDRIGFTVAVTISQLSIVDLAGSEQTRDSQTTGQQLKEAGKINKSLMFLKQCMRTLRKNQEQKEKTRKIAIIPFTQSKLTELFQSFLTGEGKTILIANMSSCNPGCEENSHVIKFSTVASKVVTI
ncbi:uncharacterized protein PGTG_12583 [Puccinia graminis f. sp. tritici CRL 75-36-700-3]|uniref:Kinesin-like protein n=1 Tax=Puccinia graminis f. sp. tritici (strain CRL 75-36-700-3 / race SCCL) TaxID=418459 RepID=E3KV36_PUCGT|nr:uncharacterized protein PGTG_12583 [Puccinia graminis f. sp. tritici CRL 75-36-700-3]EFP88136.1 hypothetical protein PGTG_12583 [Puccinia graminis f. sp. tritici CRL 75-36-700-3]